MPEFHDTQISQFVRELLPTASDAELQHAQTRYEEYLDTLIRIYRRLEAEGYFSRPRDKTSSNGIVESEE